MKVSSILTLLRKGGNARIIDSHKGMENEWDSWAYSAGAYRCEYINQKEPFEKQRAFERHCSCIEALINVGLVDC